MRRSRFGDETASFSCIGKYQYRLLLSAKSFSLNKYRWFRDSESQIWLNIVLFMYCLLVFMKRVYYLCSVIMNIFF